MERREKLTPRARGWSPVLAALVAILPLALPAPAIAQVFQEPKPFNPTVGDPRAATDPRYDISNSAYDYDPKADPDHPLKEKAPPGPEWEENLSGNGALAKADWPWGEMFYDGVYPSKLITTNRCETPEEIAIVVSDLPFVTAPATMIVAPGVTEIPLTITAPPTPPPPIRLGLPDEPGYGWVEPPHYDPATGTALRYPGEPEFHQPNFGTAEGAIEIWHAWNPPCAPSLETYTVAGHFHFRPPAPEGEGSASLEVADPCLVYWNLSEPPPGFDGRDCADAFRGHAGDFLARTLDYAIRLDPDRWRWLPSAAEIGTMGAEALLAMKARAEALIADAGLPPPAAVADLCVAAWVDGTAPAGLDPDACTTHFRAFAAGGVSGADPDAARGLPSAEEVRSMSAGDLLSIRERVRAARRGEADR